MCIEGEVVEKVGWRYGGIEKRSKTWEGFHVIRRDSFYLFSTNPNLSPSSHKILARITQKSSLPSGGELETNRARACVMRKFYDFRCAANGEERGVCM